MIDIVPELKIIIGEQPAVLELPPQDAQWQFQLVFRRYIDVLASPEHPLAQKAFQSDYAVLYS